ncbi:pikAII [Symbiodinium sp. CCMP2592]|nr:pikAII [Symbiodinium sp. CCMP2592]
MHSELLAPVLPGWSYCHREACFHHSFAALSGLERELQTCAFSCPAEGVMFVSCLSGARETLEMTKPDYWLSADLDIAANAVHNCFTDHLQTRSLEHSGLLTTKPVSCQNKEGYRWRAKSIVWWIWSYTPMQGVLRPFASLHVGRVILRQWRNAVSMDGVMVDEAFCQVAAVGAELHWPGQAAVVTTSLLLFAFDLHPVRCGLAPKPGDPPSESRQDKGEGFSRAPQARPMRDGEYAVGIAIFEGKTLRAQLSMRDAVQSDSDAVGNTQHGDSAYSVLRHAVAAEWQLSVAVSMLSPLIMQPESACILSDCGRNASAKICRKMWDTVFESAFVLSASSQAHAEVQILPTGAKLSSRSGDGHTSHAQSQSTRVVGGPGARGSILQHSLVEWKTLEKLGLEYGPSFRAISSWSSSGDGSHVLGRLSLNLETWDSSLEFHPGILDGAIQLLLLACSSSDSQQCFLPFSIDNCVIAATLPSRDVCVTVLVRTVSAEAVSGDVEISTDDGVLIARLSRLSCRARDRRPELTESKQQPPQQPPQLEQMYSVAFVEMESSRPDLPKMEIAEMASDAVVWCSEERQGELLAALSWKAESCSFARDETTALSLLGSGKFGYVAFLAEGDQLEALYNALQVLQMSSKLNTSVVLAAQAVAEEVLLSALAAAAPAQLSLRNRGSFSSLVPEPQQSKSGFRVAAVGLNFRDVLNVLDLYPGDPGEPGLDCSGIVLDGPHAAHAALPGTRLFGISFGCLRTFATIKDRSIPELIWGAPLFAFRHSLSVQEPRLLVERPASWSHVEAAALPTVFTTVDMALCELAGLKAGQRVLIHAGAGGVGLTAVQYALRLGALVYATAGKEDKQSLLRQMGVTCVASSRDGSKFEEELANALAKENSAKIDVVLNSLRTLGKFIQLL